MILRLSNGTTNTQIYTLSLHDALPILTSKEAKMGKVMRHTLGASLNIRHNLSSSKGPKPLQLKLLTTYIPKTSVCRDRKSGSAGMPRPTSYAVFCLKKKSRKTRIQTIEQKQSR